MSLEQLNVCEIVERAVSKMVDIPEFQREFVWDTEQVKKLAESLYRNYPVGSFLLWDSYEYQETKAAQGSKASLWIVDGQQRTTALCLLLGRKPYWWKDVESWNKALARYDVMVNLLPENGDDRLEFALPNPIRRHDPRWINVRSVLTIEKVENLTPVAQEIAKAISTDQSQMMDTFGKVHARLQSLWQIRKLDIPIIKINHEVEDVAEIFARLNQEGTRVREADVVLALAAVRNPGWVRNKYLPFCNKLEERGWSLDAGVFVRTMTGIGKKRARLIEVPKDFWEPNNLPGIWNSTKSIIDEVLRRLAEFGIMSSDLLPSMNSLIPLFVMHHHWHKQQGYRFKKAFRWFLLANRDGRYSGSAITSLNEDVRSITESENFDRALEALQKRLNSPPSISKEEFLSRYDRAGHRFLRLMLYLLLFHHKAKDWVDDIRIGYEKTGSPLATGFDPQWHHIFPRNVLVKAGISDDEIHALANITVLNERTNVNKLSGKEPSRYIKDFGISKEYLLNHLIDEYYAEAVLDSDLLAQRWRVENYRDFLDKRAEFLSQEANIFLEELKDA